MIANRDLAGAQCPPKGININAASEIAQFNRESSPPVGMLIHRAWNIRLILETEEIVDCDRKNARRRTCKKLDGSEEIPRRDVLLPKFPFE